MKLRCVIVELALLVFACVVSVTAQTAAPGAAQRSDSMNLAGRWTFSLDRDDVGVGEQWFKRDLTGSITLPGILQSQGYGDEINIKTPWVISLYDRNWFLRAEYKRYAEAPQVKVPYLSQPPRHYVGAAWYQREIEIPEAWQDRRVVLTLERPHWETTVWLEEKKIGSDNSLVASHVYDLGVVSPGRKRLTIRIDNRMILPYRPDAHGVSDSLGGSWNGIVGRIDLTTTSLVWIEDAQVFPGAVKNSALVKVRIGNRTPLSGNGVLTVGSTTSFVSWDASGGKKEIEVPLGKDAKAWDEFSPALQRLKLRLSGDHAEDQRELVFGLRDLRTDGKQFVINGRPTVFRGTHHGGDFPLTGYPPTDVEYWRKIIRTCKQWGLNHIRFHSFCPPESAFIAADELGFYLQPEPGMWNEITPGTPMERMLYQETDRMIKAYGNHPSFLLLSASNEPKGNWKESLSRWVEHYRREDPRRLYTSGTGHTEREIPNITAGTDYLAIQRIGPKMLRRESAWFGRDYGESLRDINIPVISHEVGQWVAYPDFDVIKKFTGYLRPGNYEIFRDSMAEHGLLDKNKEFAWASGRCQLECYKEEIEANLRTPGLGGFQLLDLHDYLGQGTALVGVLDAFWEPKSYATAKEFRRFCNTTVPLARLSKRVFTSDEELEINVEAAHYGAEPIKQANTNWKILDSSGTVAASGEFPSQTIAIGKNISLGTIRVAASQLSAPARYKLVVSIDDVAENDWNFWVYPSDQKSSVPREVLVTSSWREAKQKLGRGGKVLYQPANGDLNWASPPLDTVPVFWNRQMGPGWGRMLGLLVKNNHPALAKFPSEANFDWQWSEIVRNVRAINLDDLPRELEPIVWAIDDWNRNYKLGVLFECKVGTGKLLVSSFDVQGDENAVAAQLRKSLLEYMASVRFQPRVAVPLTQIEKLFFDTRIMSRLGAEVSAAGGPQNAAANVIDGDPNTFWLAGDAKSERVAQDLTVTFPGPVSFSGLMLMPRQNHREHEGDIREYEISVSDDGDQWREVKSGELLSTFEPQRIIFTEKVTARKLKLTALSGFGTDKLTALAELAVIYEGPDLIDTESRKLQYERNKTATPEIDEGTGDSDAPKKSRQKTKTKKSARNPS
jgi:hypothetical protein